MQLRASFSGSLALGLCLSLAGCGSAASGPGDAGGAADGTTASGGATVSNATHTLTTTSTGAGGTAGVSASASGSTSGTGDGSGGSSGGGNGSVTSTTGTGSGPACPGVVPRPDVPGETCRSPGDCDASATCSPDPFSGCGFCIEVQRDCESDDQCDPGERCVEFESSETCLCAYGAASECRPACTASSCGDGHECVDEVCRQRSCENGFTCDAALVCAPGRQTSDAHGCAPPNCNEGRQCESGTTCDTETGECRVVHCTNGGTAACPVNTECEPDALGRGCVPKACDVDADCDCGVCIQSCIGDSCPRGQCANRLYVCQHPVP